MGIFQGRPIGETPSPAMEILGNKCDDLYTLLRTFFTENSRYLSICQTKLEEFSMFANKAITCDDNFKHEKTDKAI